MPAPRDVLAQARRESDLEAWEPWTPAELLQRFGARREPWYVAGGWAIDLFLQQPTRAHEDIEIGVRADDFGAFAADLVDCDLFVAGNGQVTRWRGLGDPVLQEHHQTWVRDRHRGTWRLDIFREPSSDGAWVARRDARIRMPYEQLIRRDPAGVPFACPEVVLLFKAKARRGKDEADFARVLPHLTPEARRWLATALAIAHPEHPWQSALA